VDVPALREASACLAFACLLAERGVGVFFGKRREMEVVFSNKESSSEVLVNEGERVRCPVLYCSLSCRVKPVRDELPSLSRREDLPGVGGAGLPLVAERGSWEPTGFRGMMVGFEVDFFKTLLPDPCSV